MVGERAYVPTGGLGSVLAMTASISARFFVPLWSLSAIFVFGPAVFFDLLKWRLGYPRESGYEYIAAGCMSLSMLLCYFVLIGAVSDIYRGGETTISKAMKRVSILEASRLVGTSVLAFLIVIAGGCVTAAPMIFVAVIVEADAAAFVALGVAYFSWVLLTVPFLFTYQVLVLEKLYWLSAIKASAWLVLRSKAVSFAIVVGLLILDMSFDLVAASLNYKYFVQIFSQFEPIVILHYNTDLISEGLPSGLSAELTGTVVRSALFPVITIFLTLTYCRLRRRTGNEATDSGALR
jgi:hypothetical protein